ncbi:flagellar basal-body MS-ring/collar protein FliF [Balneolaceae bacterium ANBcel3]|nr:flagellar basal-body MS-ring/collar protein FliF [Balneolaceae bacterium ANBcel3]
MGRFTESIRAFFEPMTIGQRLIFAMLTVVMLIFLAGTFYWTLRPEYSLLFGSLNNDSAREIVSELEDRGVDYRVEDSGRSIFVPSSRVHELRMQLASLGLAHSDVQGYELFDANALGMTDFMQRVNMKRALEGELSRSISSLEQVEHSRVHLVLPERTPFQQTTVEASASIILTLKRGQRLSQAQVEGMTSLVAGSVEGLQHSAITVLDQNGNRLTEGMAGDSDFASGSQQIKLRQKTESYLTERGQTMLDRVLGPGNSILRVAVEHDFDRLSRESDIIDPDSRIIISEERRQESSSDAGFQQVPIDEFTPVNERGQTVMTSSRDNESTIQTRNYEVNKIREIFEKPQGEIRRITASVLLNYKQDLQDNEEGGSVMIAEPYTTDELEELREVVRTALGIQMERGDEMSITQIQFYDPLGDERYFGVERPVPWNEIIRWSLILAALLLFVLLIYNSSKRIREETTPVLFRGSPDGPELKIDDDSDMDEEQQRKSGMGEEEENYYNRKLSKEAQKEIAHKSFIMDEIRDFVELQPDDAASVIRAILNTETKK